MASVDWKYEIEQFTEQDWLLSKDPHICYELAIVTLEEDPPSKRVLVPSNRKLRLFGCACCRRIWHLLSTDWAKECVVLAEAYCDGFVGETELSAAFLKAPESLLRLGGWDVARVAEAAGAGGAGEARSTWALVAARDVCAPNGGMPKAELPLQMRRNYCPETQDRDWDERAAQAALLRDIYGNPFRAIAFDPAWRIGRPAGIASMIYGERDFASMPELADALEVAGCYNADILAHCREPGIHVRGCWVVDLVLGKH